MLRRLFLTSLLCAAGAAQAAGPAVTPAQSLAATCFNCHGPQGISNGAIPSLAGRSAESTIVALQDYRTGKLKGTIMPQISKGYTDAQIRLIADYFAQQKQ
ncbi:cytochrome subunit of sulfide dehydrogenase [mine drainage metagenome]|jgi:cytochrome c553|uniref:Cytochrome subunit of sulfide dehydrogenase n=1 Tax=mine drainage metagenome TaxID=410659 RepID=A0A1J5Q0Z1_9ZZZZ